MLNDYLNIFSHQLIKRNTDMVEHEEAVVVVAVAYFRSYVTHCHPCNKWWEYAL